ncbi:MAG: hypothetical protein JNL32_01015 [Candidatus Kapabacteria bacterium]|nr:hypothetical protein [Candidatus Kapabacteria bacterium]
MLEYLRKSKTQYEAWKQQRKDQWHQMIALLCNATYKREGVSPFTIVLIETVVLSTIVVTLSILLFLTSEHKESTNPRDPYPNSGIGFLILIPLVWLYGILRYVEFRSALIAFWYLVGQTAIIFLVLAVGTLPAFYFGDTSPLNIILFTIRSFGELLEVLIQLPTDTYKEVPFMIFVLLDFIIFYQMANACMKLMYQMYLRFKRKKISLAE